MLENVSLAVLLPPVELVEVHTLIENCVAVIAAVAAVRPVQLLPGAAIVMFPAGFAVAPTAFPDDVSKVKPDGASIISVPPESIWVMLCSVNARLGDSVV